MIFDYMPDYIQSPDRVETVRMPTHSANATVRPTD